MRDTRIIAPASSLFVPALALAALLAPSGGCGGRLKPNIADRDAAAKIPGIKKAVREKDGRAVRQLVEDLDNDDPAVRMFAIAGLRRLTGQEFGYDYSDDEEERKPAVARWRQWLDDPAATRPAPGPGRGGR